MRDPQHKLRTLSLISMLHAFTHVYQVALLPLYLPIQKGFRLENLGSSTFLVTLLMLAYFIPSYPMGVLADRVSRKKLLAFGLAINALGFLGLAWAPNYSVALAAMVVAGFGGSFFHPAATALIAGLFPTGTGRALGIIGIGAGAGFFLGPIYAGWRASQSGNWRTPVLELGLLGLLAAAVFYWLAVEIPSTRVADQVERSAGQARGRLFGTFRAGAFFVAAAFAFSLRDFAGSSMGSLGSLFLQQAHGFSVDDTGRALSGIFLASVISNPLFGHLSDRGRKRWTCLVHAVAAVLIILVPHLPGGRSHLFFLLFMAYGFFFMASYPMVEAAVMGVVAESARGRAFGLWITIGGLTGSLSHWLAGRWVEGLGPLAMFRESYYGFYVVLACLLLVSLIGLFWLEGAGRYRTPAPELAGSDTSCARETMGAPPLK
ncbi:MAG TPA: MFS transporter [Verrucomicrobiae bacterium]|nr:MFS transporter [Verrucomicrobiae bacterium]